MLSLIKKRKAHAWCAFILLSSLLISNSAFAQIRNSLDTPVKYDRPDMLIQNGGCVYNVKNPPSGQRAARGNNSTDDTRALKDAYTYVLNRTNVSEGSFGKNYIIYLPAGTYLVSDTITYNGPTRFSNDGIREDCNHIHIVGERRATTQIRLKPQAPGFTNASRPKAVVAFARPDVELNNWVGGNTLRNLTINCTSNRGAIGVDFWGANTSRIQNIRVLANVGRGHIGIHFRQSVTMGYFSDILIQEFSHAVKLEMNAQNANLRGRATHTTFEHITCVGSRAAAFSVETCSATIRKLRTLNVTKAISLEHSSAQVILLDSNLDGRNVSGSTAMQIDGAGHLFARNVTVQEFGTSIRQNGSVAEARRNISEYSSYPLESTRNNNNTYDLLIRDVPIVRNTNSSEWAKPNGLGNAAVQAALNSGKSEIYFPSTSKYNFGTVQIPRGVNRLHGMFQNLEGTFVINQNAATPLVIKDTARGKFKIVNNTQRSIIIESATGLNRIENNGEHPTQRWYINNTGQFRTETVTNCEVYSRAFNQEGFQIVDVRNCTWIVMGWKGERHTGAAIEVRNGSDVEILGTTAGVKEENALFRLYGSGNRATYIGANSADYFFRNAIVDGGTGVLRANIFPKRTFSNRRFYTFTAH